MKLLDALAAGMAPLYRIPPKPHQRCRRCHYDYDPRDKTIPCALCNPVPGVTPPMPDPTSKRSEFEMRVMAAFADAIMAARLHSPLAKACAALGDDLTLVAQETILRRVNFAIDHGVLDLKENLEIFANVVSIVAGVSDDIKAAAARVAPLAPVPA